MVAHACNASTQGARLESCQEFKAMSKYRELERWHRGSDQVLLLTASAEDQSSVPSTHTNCQFPPQLAVTPTLGNPTLLWTIRAPVTHLAYSHSGTYTQIKVLF